MARYIIVKKMITDKFYPDGEPHFIHVIMNDSQGEVEEFESEEEVNKMVSLLNANTDSGHTYLSKKIVD
jgi:hypothetical protein